MGSFLALAAIVAVPIGVLVALVVLTPRSDSDALDAEVNVR